MIGPTDLLHPSPAPHFKICQVFLICCLKRPSFSTIQNHSPNVAFYYFLPQIEVQFSGKKSLLLAECNFCHANPGFNFTCTSSIIYIYMRVCVCVWVCVCVRARARQNKRKVRSDEEDTSITVHHVGCRRWVWRSGCIIVDKVSYFSINLLKETFLLSCGVTTRRGSGSLHSRGF